MLNKYYNERFPMLEIPRLILAGGTKYLKVQVIEQRGSEVNPSEGFRAFAFIDLTNGDILKPATWKKPAKHARGNIFDEHGGMKWMGPYGPAYMEAMKA
jgi:hypothetical protein